MKQESSSSFSGFDGFKRKARPFLLPGLILIAILFSAILVLKPRLNDVFAQQKKLKREKERLGRLIQKAAALQGLNEYELAAKTEWALKVLPVEKDLPLALSSFRSLSQSADLILTDIKAQPGEISTASAKAEPGDKAKAQKKKTQEEAAPSLSFQVSTYGSLGSLANFLSKINLAAPLMRAVNVSLSQSEGEVESQIEIKIFYLGLPEALTSLEQPLPLITREENEVYEKLSGIKILESEVSLQTIESGRENPFTF